MLATLFFKLSLILVLIIGCLGSLIAVTIAFTTVVNIPPVEALSSAQATPTATLTVAHSNAQVQGGAIPTSASVVLSSGQTTATIPAVAYSNTQVQGGTAIHMTTSIVLSSDQAMPTAPPAIAFTNTQGGSVHMTTSVVLSSDQTPPFTAVSKAGTPIHLDVASSTHDAGASASSEAHDSEQHTSAAAVGLSSTHSSSAVQPTSTDLDTSIFHINIPLRPPRKGTGIMDFWW